MPTAHVLHMQVDQVCEGGGIDHRRFAQRLAQIDTAFGPNRPLPCVLVAQEGLAGLRLFASDPLLAAPSTPDAARHR